MANDSAATVSEVAHELEQLRSAAADCHACPLWELGTQTVFGSGPPTARVMVVGEAPGQQEDRAGVPFVGPSGQLLDEALERAGLQREQVYVTNVVKHRPTAAVNGRRKNRAPKRSEIKVCAPLWLHRELALARPALVCCLGAVAAKELLGQSFRLTQQRGEWFAAETCRRACACHVAPRLRADPAC